MVIFKRELLVLLMISMTISSSFCQSQKAFNFYPDSLNKSRFNRVIVAESGLMISSFFLLNELWYKDYPKSNFHFINDLNEWNGIDKLGHSFATYNLSKYNYGIFRWTGLDDKKALLYSSGIALGYLTFIEILDGLSSEWGFSMADMGANLMGTALFAGQELLWNEQRINFKFSYHSSKYHQYRPDVFGSNYFSRVFKDYNGSTFWLSANIHSFLHKNSNFPKWLNIAFGYGVDGLTGGDKNYTQYDHREIPSFVRQSQFYLSLDIDLSKIPTQSKFLHLLFHTINFIKVPLPTLELNKVDGLKFHPIYF